MFDMLKLNADFKQSFLYLVSCTKTSNMFLNACGKIISAKTLLDENMWAACMERLHL